jgi:hypothetical protein
LLELKRRRAPVLSLLSAAAVAVGVLPFAVGAAAQTAASAPVVTTVSLPTNDLVFDEVSGRLYASVPSRAGELGNRVVALDPASGAVLGSTFVGSEPGKLALSSGGEFLYVGLDGAAAVRRVALPSLTPGLQFPLGSDPSRGLYLVEDIEVLPDKPGAVAVSRKTSGSPRHAGVAIYDEGVKLPEETPRHTGSNQIEFGVSPTRLYGYNNETSEAGFRRMTVSSGGVATVDVVSGLGGPEIEFADGRLYGSSGQVIDPENRILLGTFALGLGGTGPVEPVPFEHRVYFVSSGSLKVFDDTTFVPLEAFPIAGLQGSPRSLVSVGGGRLAFRTTGDQLLLVKQIDETPPTVDVPLHVSTDADGPGGAAVGYEVTATDNFDRAPLLACSPASGSVFPIGDTSVSCTATDEQGNSATASFDVHVLGAQEQIVALAAAVAAAPEIDNRNRRWIRSTLLSSLADAESHVGQAGPEDAEACAPLRTFAAFALTHTSPDGPITADHGNAWQAAASRIAAVLACDDEGEPPADTAPRPPAPPPSLEPAGPRKRPPAPSRT